MLGRLASGETRVVSNFGVLNEGWDCPACEVCILARPTASLALYYQMIGRVLRPAAAAGKVRALVLDYAGGVLRHGWPTADRPWTLKDRPKKPGRPMGAGGDEDEQAFICDRCHAAAPGRPKRCPACGYEPPGALPDLTQESGVPLVEITRETVQTAAAAQRAAFRASRSPTFDPRPWSLR